MSKSIYRTTKAEFETFKKTFLAWRKRLGLTEYRICFEHYYLKDAYAECHCDAEGRIATIIMTTEMSEKDGEKVGWDASDSGRHEALELLLSEMQHVATSRYIRPDDVMETRHAVIRRLESLFDELEK